MDGFADLGLSKPVREALEHMGYEAPSPVQAQTIPLLLEGKDVIAQALTGIAPRSSSVAFFSTVTGELMDTAGLSAEYWYPSWRSSLRSFINTYRH